MSKPPMSPPPSSYRAKKPQAPSATSWKPSKDFWWTFACGFAAGVLGQIIFWTVVKGPWL
ncbi:hypothetical protein BAJUN_01100 [Bajunvirus bajun]|uniref:Uncharacterized protein n=1 Tax=Brevundimonas phage vB_BgoS-Bajun TaxID=2948594 RepID=A0A9E7N686_9CAUD|nr:hypothetical protein BAJUN_01100 [Brevundimonas phage vB_BgoS-Bajun]